MNQELLKHFLYYDKTSGIFIWKNSIATSVKEGDIAGYKLPSGYWRIRLNRVEYYAHRLAFLYMTGSIPDIVDHINRNKSDNRFSNLRDGSNSVNNKNKSISKNNTSGITGVGNYNGKFIAYIYNNYKNIHLGSFTDIEDARQARKNAEKKYNFSKNHGINI